MNPELSAICYVRDYKPTDKAFIMATWLRGLYYGDSWFSLIPKDIFMDNYKHILERIVDHSSVIKIACLKEDPDTILGYAVMSKDLNTLHWAHVKKVWREKGLARSLIPQQFVFVSHLSALGKTLLSKLNCSFNPFSIN